MSNVWKIMKADSVTTGRNVLRAGAVALFFYLYMKVLSHNHIGVSIIVGMGQSILIYMQSMMDLTQNIPTYIGMGCARKHVAAAFWCRWLILFLAVMAVSAVLFYFTEPGALAAGAMTGLATGFGLVLGLNCIAMVAADYNRLAGVLIGCLTIMLVGILSGFLSGSNDSSMISMASLMSRMSDTAYAVSVTASAIVLIVGAFVYNLHLFRFSIR